MLDGSSKQLLSLNPHFDHEEKDAEKGPPTIFFLNKCVFGHMLLSKQIGCGKLLYLLIMATLNELKYQKLMLLKEENATTPVLGTYCGRSPKPSLDTFGNTAKVIFHADDVDQEKSGFLIKVNASIEGEILLFSDSN